MTTREELDAISKRMSDEFDALESIEGHKLGHTLRIGNKGTWEALRLLADRIDALAAKE